MSGLGSGPLINQLLDVGCWEGGMTLGVAALFSQRTLRDQIVVYFLPEALPEMG